MTEYGFPVFTLCSVVLDLLPLTQDVSGTQGFTFLVQLLELMIDLEVISPTALFLSIPDFPDNY